MHRVKILPTLNGHGKTVNQTREAALARSKNPHPEKVSLTDKENWLRLLDKT
jgi:hypothetical protein